MPNGRQIDVSQRGLGNRCGDDTVMEQRILERSDGTDTDRPCCGLRKRKRKAKAKKHDTKTKVSAVNHRNVKIDASAPPELPHHSPDL